MPLSLRIQSQPRDRFMVSYFTMRRWIGALGILLPVVVVAGGKLIKHLPVLPSISAYYYSNMEDWFVGLLCVVGVFLLSYDAYPGLDRAICALCGACAIGVAFFPTLAPDHDPRKPVPVGIFQLPDDISSRFHYTFAVALFIGMAAMSLFLFTRSDPAKGGPTPQKKKRNGVYVACGLVMAAALLTGLIRLAIQGPEDSSPFTLYVEGVCLIAFGISWITKGEVVFKDICLPPQELPTAGSTSAT